MSELTDNMRTTLKDMCRECGDVPEHVVIDTDELLALLTEAETAHSQRSLQAIGDILVEYRLIDNESRRYRLAWLSARKRAWRASAGWHNAFAHFKRVDRESQRYRNAWRNARHRAAARS